MKRILFAIVLVATTAIWAHDYLPGAAQETPILLRGGSLYTVASGVLENTDLLFEDGRITAIGPNLGAPAGARVIDVSGKRVYPGLIDAASVIGLIEIGAVRATNDLSEVGSIHPEVQAHIAYNTDSEIIPSIRVTGVTSALVVPQGGVLSGRSSLINLDGWTWEDAAEAINVGIHVNWPRQRIITAWWMEDTPAEQKKKNAESLKRLQDAITDARAYYVAKQVDSEINVDARWEAMLPVFRGEKPLFINANDYRQIEQALNLAIESDFELILVGGRDSWMLADRLGGQDIPVILGRVQSLPRHEDDAYDLPYRLPALLAAAGVRFCFSSGFSATGSRNLPFQAGQAIGFGLSPEAALQGLTLSAAEILGVAKDLGSLEVGKKATLVVSEGDLLDPITNKVILEFIEGREVNLENKHRELYRKYKTKTIRSR